MCLRNPMFVNKTEHLAHVVVCETDVQRRYLGTTDSIKLEDYAYDPNEIL